MPSSCNLAFSTAFAAFTAAGPVEMLNGVFLLLLYLYYCYMLGGGPGSYNSIYIEHTKHMARQMRPTTQTTRFIFMMSKRPHKIVIFKTK